MMTWMKMRIKLSDTLCVYEKDVKSYVDLFISCVKQKNDIVSLFLYLGLSIIHFFVVVDFNNITFPYILCIIIHSTPP